MPFFPPAVIAAAPQAQPPLRFLGFSAGMPTADAVSLLRGAGGTLTCKPTTDPRLKECNGRLPRAGTATAFEVLISSIHDSAAVIVFSLHSASAPTTRWVTEVSREYGTPNKRQSGGQSSWQWIRNRRMLRIVQRGSAARREASVTLTHGPLLDGLGPAGTPRP